MTLFTHMKKILQDEFGDLPTNGVLAGQAVAEAFFIASGLPIKSRMKDLDWFVEKDEYIENPRLISAVAGKPTVEIGTPSHDVDLYVGEFVKFGLYTIVTSDIINGGRINRVVVEDPESSKKVTPMTILDGFDINSAACSLDLDSGTVVEHPKFIEFCQTKKLDFISIHTPLSSLIRIIEKNRYIEGTVIDVPELTCVASSAIWSRYSHNYTSFEESVIKAPDYYQKGTGITCGRYETLSETVKAFLLEKFNKCSIFLSDGGELLTFIPKQEPRRITALINTKSVDIQVIGYSLDFIRYVTSVDDTVFFNTVVYPLSAMTSKVTVDEEFRSIAICLKGLLLKRVYVDGVALLKSEFDTLHVTEVMSLLGLTSPLNQNEKVLFSNVLERLYVCLFHGNQTTEFRSEERSLASIGCLLADVKSWSLAAESLNYNKLDVSLQCIVVNEIVKGLDVGVSVGVSLSNAMNKKIDNVDLSNVPFGFDQESMVALNTQYDIHKIETLSELANTDSYNQAYIHNTTGVDFVLMSVNYQGYMYSVVCAVLWVEYLSAYRIYSLNDGSFNPITLELTSVLRGVVLHAETTLNQNKKYSFLRLKAAKRQVKDILLTGWRSLVEAVTQNLKLKGDFSSAFWIVKNANKEPDHDELPF